MLVPSTLPEYQDPLHILLEYIAEEAPLDCDMLLVHDDDLVQLEGIFDSAPLAALRHLVLSYLRNIEPILHVARIDLPSACNKASVDAESASSCVATLSNVFDKQSPSPTLSASFSSQVKMSSTTGELSPSSAGFIDDRTSAAYFPPRKVPGSAGTLPGHATDRSPFSQRLRSARQPVSGPLHPLRLPYGDPLRLPYDDPLRLPYGGESPSRKLNSSPGSGSARPNPKAYSNQRPADNLSLNKNASSIRDPFFRSPLLGSGNTSSTASKGPKTTAKTNRTTTQPSLAQVLAQLSPPQALAHNRDNRDNIDPISPFYEPLVILRVQVISCNNLLAKNREGYSDPFVVVSILEEEFKTPVCKRNLNPVYAPKDATFEFPIHSEPRLLSLKFAVWDKGKFGEVFLGKSVLSVNEWFKGTAFAFDDPQNEPILVGLLSSRTTTILQGTMRIKVGFVHSPTSTSQPDFSDLYNILANRVLPVGPQAGCVGIVTLLICKARELPDWPTVTGLGWDMDPYLKVSIEDDVQSTQVIRHCRNPVWNKQLVLHVRERDLSLPIVLSVFHWNKFSFDDHIGDVNIHISQLGTTEKEDLPTTGIDSDDLSSMSQFSNIPLVTNPTRPYRIIPTLTFCARYQSYDEVRQQGGH
ncbi:C2 domain containing protein [Lactarius tabidus]